MLKRGCLAPAVLLMCVGCRYTAKSRVPDGLDVVAVPIFRNQTLYRDIELDLAQALRKEILAKTRLRVADMSDRRADAYLDGEITDFKLTRLKEDIQGRVIEYHVRLAADVALRDRNTQEVIGSTRHVSRWAEFQVGRDQQMSLAREEAVRELAREIVNEVFQRW